MPKIDREFARKQIGRLESKTWFPRTTAGIGALIDALIESCPKESNARTTIDRIDRDFEDCPSTNDIRRVAWELVNLAEWKPPGEPDCPECLDSGYRTVKKGGLEGAERCPCSMAGKMNRTS